MMFCEKVRAVLKKYSMLEKGQKLAVAFSGGADSVALLHFLYKEGYEPCAIHVNHGIRGEEADADEDFCRDFCEKNSISFYSVHINIPSEAKKRGEGLEECARRLRYSEIEKITDAEGIQRVATAHHADDNMETLIFNITRGASLKGAGGIPPVRERYIRPLIETERCDILEYCKNNSLEYVTDSTNSDTDYTRNFIRHRIIPEIREINPEAAKSFARFTACARRDEEFIQSEAQKLTVNTKRHELASCHLAVLTRFIYNSCDKFNVVPSAKTTDSLISAIKMGNEYKCIDMGGNLRAVCDRDTLRFEKKEVRILSFETFKLENGENDLLQMGKLFVTDDKEYFDNILNIYKISVYTKLNFDKIKGTLFVRRRNNGDYFRYGGMTRSLKKLLNSKKLTVRQRDMLPLICDDAGIAWIPSFPARDGLKPKENEKILYIGYIGEENDNE